MRSEKPQIGIRKAKPSDPKNLGVIKFGKSRPDKTKYVIVDFEYDERAGNSLYKIGMKLLAKDKEAVINYLIVQAIKNTAKLKCEK
jgi:hypothetical protein